VKPCALRPQAREDRRNEIHYYRKEAGPAVAIKLVAALEKALQDLQHQPAMGSPALGIELGLRGMRCWRIDGYPLTFWYFEREAYLDVARLVGQRQDALDIDIAESRRVP
jgi:toxin ParE1/3/4